MIDDGAMPTPDRDTEIFERSRGRLYAIAYRLLGSAYASLARLEKINEVLLSGVLYVLAAPPTPATAARLRWIACRAFLIRT